MTSLQVTHTHIDVQFGEDGWFGGGHEGKGWLGGVIEEDLFGHLVLFGCLQTLQLLTVLQEHLTVLIVVLDGCLVGGQHLLSILERLRVDIR